MRRTLASGLGVDDHVRDVRPLEADLLLDLARARVGLVEARLRPRGRASGTRRGRRRCAGSEARAAPRRSRSGRRAVTAAAPSASTSRASRTSASGSRCVWMPVISGTAARIAVSSSSAIACASSSGSSPGSFTCSESSVRPSTSTSDEVVHLAHLPHADRGRVRPLAQVASPASGSTCTTTSASGSARLDRRLDRVGGRVALADGGAGRDGDHDVGELAAAGLPHPQPPQLDGRLQRRRSPSSAAASASAGARSISTSTLTLIRRAAASSTSTPTKSAAIGSPFGWPRARERADRRERRACRRSRSPKCSAFDASAALP